MKTTIALTVCFSALIPITQSFAISERMLQGHTYQPQPRVRAGTLPNGGQYNPGMRSQQFQQRNGGVARGPDFRGSLNQGQINNGLRPQGPIANRPPSNAQPYYNTDAARQKQAQELMFQQDQARMREQMNQDTRNHQQWREKIFQDTQNSLRR